MCAREPIIKGLTGGLHHQSGDGHRRDCMQAGKEQGMVYNPQPKELTWRRPRNDVGEAVNHVR